MSRIQKIYDSKFVLVEISKHYHRVTRRGYPRPKNHRDRTNYLDSLLLNIFPIFFFEKIHIHYDIKKELVVDVTS